MSCLVGIVDYGLSGNLYNIIKAVEKVGGETLIIKNSENLDKVDKIILPGVGSFKDTMNKLEQMKMIEPLKTAIQNKPTLGICLGMQILSTIGREYGKTNGLNLISAEVTPIEVDDVIPHVGFNKIDVIKENKLFMDIEDKEFYFMHSYQVVNFHDVTSTTTYADHIFVSSIKKENIYGVQFHPEKSKEAGLKLFHNFINL